VAVPANPIWSWLLVEVEVDRRFDVEVVRQKVKDALIDPDSGPLATKNAPIGRPLYRSAIFDAIHSVEGVASVLFAYLWRGWVWIDLSDASRSSVCGGANDYLDFADGQRVFVLGVTATAPVPSAGGTT
jgi:hypothetical protein